MLRKSFLVASLIVLLALVLSMIKPAAPSEPTATAVPPTPTIAPTPAPTALTFPREEYFISEASYLTYRPYDKTNVESVFLVGKLANGKIAGAILTGPKPWCQGSLCVRECPWNIVSTRFQPYVDHEIVISLQMHNAEVDALFAKYGDVMPRVWQEISTEECLGK